MEKSNVFTSIKNMLDAQGVTASALPLSECTVTRPYLLDRCKISVESGTAIMLVIPYLVSDVAQSDCRNVSLYAVAKDYHLYVKELSDILLPRLHKDFPNYSFYFFADHSPIDERDAAARARLGIKGLNGMLITPQYGSFVFLAEIITDAPIECKDFIPRSDDIPTCNNCGACQRACPLQCADTRESCLSALTQKKGELTLEEQEILRSHSLVWGCDTCQLVCPLNQAIIATDRNTEIQFFKDDLIQNLNVDILVCMPDLEFEKRAYSWRKKDTILRNLKLQGCVGKEKTCSD